MSIDINDLLSLQVQQMRVPFWQWYLHQHSMNWRGGISSNLFILAASQWLACCLFFLDFSKPQDSTTKSIKQGSILWWHENVVSPLLVARNLQKAMKACLFITWVIWQKLASKHMCVTGWFLTLLSHAWEKQGFLTWCIVALSQH